METVKKPFSAVSCLKHRTSTTNPSACRISRDSALAQSFTYCSLCPAGNNLMLNYLTAILQMSLAHYLLDPDTCQSLHSLIEMSLSRLILILPLWALLSNVICKDKKRVQHAWLNFGIKMALWIHQEAVHWRIQEMLILISDQMVTVNPWRVPLDFSVSW